MNTTPAPEAPVRRPTKLANLADMLGLSEVTLRRLCRSGEVRAVQVGRTWLVPADETDRLLGR